jgi:membrane protein
MIPKRRDAQRRAARRASARQALTHTPVAEVWRIGKDMELMHRSMGFAALGFLTLVPLLILVAAIDPASGLGAGKWLGQALGVSRRSQDQIARLFREPAALLQRTTVLGLAALATFGLSFGSAVQTGYEKAWDMPPARWHTMWRHVIWLASLILYLVVFIRTPLTGHSPVITVGGAITDTILTVLFFWWSLWMLLAGRVAWRAVLPGGVATAIGMLGLRGFSRAIFSPLIASNAITYGPFGTVLVVQSWLVGVGVVVYGGAVVGRVAYEWHRRRQAIRGRRIPLR